MHTSRFFNRTEMMILKHCRSLGGNAYFLPQHLVGLCRENWLTKRALRDKRRHGSTTINLSHPSTFPFLCVYRLADQLHDFEALEITRDNIKAIGNAASHQNPLAEIHYDYDPEATLCDIGFFINNEFPGLQTKCNTWGRKSFFDKLVHIADCGDGELIANLHLTKNQCGQFKKLLSMTDYESSYSISLATKKLVINSEKFDYEVELNGKVINPENYAFSNFGEGRLSDDVWQKFYIAAYEIKIYRAPFEHSDWSYMAVLQSTVGSKFEGLNYIFGLRFNPIPNLAEITQLMCV